MNLVQGPYWARGEVPDSINRPAEKQAGFLIEAWFSYTRAQARLRLAPAHLAAQACVHCCNALHGS